MKLVDKFKICCRIEKECRHGLVVQLVRTPPCHGSACRFAFRPVLRGFYMVFWGLGIKTCAGKGRLDEY